MEPAKTQNVQITTILEKVATTSKTTRQPPPITSTLVTNQSKVSATIASTGFRKWKLNWKKKEKTPKKPTHLLSKTWKYVSSF